jgi:ATP-dependent DNA ligase
MPDIRHSAFRRRGAGVLAPMLARLESTLPRGPEWRYEPKLDGLPRSAVAIQHGP